MDPVLFSRLLRWTLGAIFIGTGIWFYEDGAWPAIIFGTVMFITGFFKPRRCVQEKQGAVSSKQRAESDL